MPPEIFRNPIQPERCDKGDAKWLIEVFVIGYILYEIDWVVTNDEESSLFCGKGGVGREGDCLDTHLLLTQEFLFLILTFTTITSIPEQVKICKTFHEI